MGKKFIIVIVEGDTDEALANKLFEDFLENNELQVYITRRDLYTDNVFLKKSIKAIIGDYIKKAILVPYKINKSEILAVFQITDIDGVFLDEENICVSENELRISYNENSIVCCNHKKREEIIERNQIKSKNINVMKNTKVLGSIDYFLFFFSCNLEHAIFDKLNLSQDEKDVYIYQYIDEYTKDQILLDLNNISKYEMTQDIFDDHISSWLNFINNKSNSRDTNVNILYNFVETFTKSKV